MSQVVAFKSPIGDLKWVVYNGEGKENLSGRMKYQSDLVLPVDSEECKNLKADIDAFWEEGRPAGLPAKKPAKSLGYRLEKEPVLDEDGNKQYGDDGKVVSKETGNMVFTFSTDTTYPSGDPKIINIFNSKGNKVDLGGKKIGNGSRGQLSGAMGIYTVKDAKGKTVIDGGVTLYLNSIRLVKFVEFSGEEAWDEADEEGGWTGEGETNDWNGESGQETTGGKATPRL